MENFEMPTPCQHCGEIFDLNDGLGSEKWYQNTVICEKCYLIEEAELEEDERWENINIEVSNALFEVKEEGAWAKLTDENRALIIQCVSKSCRTTEIVQKYNDGKDEVKYRRPFGSKEAFEMMQDVDKRCRKDGYFYRHVC